jgi:putative flippase GtrA
MMTRMPRTGLEARLAAKFAGVSLLGFVTDALVLHVGTSAGLEAAWARVISLASAMQVTFLINALVVFKSHDRSAWPRQWLRYMASNGFGNFCNYWIFVTLVSLRWRIVSDHMVALSAGAFCAWMMNFACARFLVFRTAGDLAPAPPEPSPGPEPA